MSSAKENTVKANVRRFNDDIINGGSYLYTGKSLSSWLANTRISSELIVNYNFAGKAVLDLGCGDGTYTLEIPSYGAAIVVGIDPAERAVHAARIKAADARLNDIVSFKLGNIYTLEDTLSLENFDCIVMRGVLHHLPDPCKALEILADFQGTLILLEPNGYNPVLKVLEKTSRYHIEHEEQSFTSNKIKCWLNNAGFNVRIIKYYNMVPMFCPDWMARSLKLLEPLFERLPLLKTFALGQCIVISDK